LERDETVREEVKGQRKRARTPGRSDQANGEEATKGNSQIGEERAIEMNETSTHR